LFATKIDNLVKGRRGLFHSAGKGVPSPAFPLCGMADVLGVRQNCNLQNYGGKCADKLSLSLKVNTGACQYLFHFQKLLVFLHKLCDYINICVHWRQKVPYCFA
jgi:hypothetical protein